MTEKTRYSINISWDCTRGWQDPIDNKWKPWNEITLSGKDAEFFKQKYDTQKIEFNCNEHGLKVTGWDSWEEDLESFTLNNEAVVTVNYCGSYRGCDAYSFYVFENGKHSCKEDNGLDYDTERNDVSSDPDHDLEEEMDVICPRVYC